MQRSWRRPSVGSMASATERNSTITGGAAGSPSMFGRRPGPFRNERSNHGTEKGTEVTPRNVAGRGRRADGRRRHAGASARELDAEEAIHRRPDAFGSPAVFGRDWRLVSREASQGGRCETADRGLPDDDEGVFGKGGLVIAEFAESSSGSG